MQIELLKKLQTRLEIRDLYITKSIIINIISIITLLEE